MYIYFIGISKNIVKCLFTAFTFSRSSFVVFKSINVTIDECLYNVYLDYRILFLSDRCDSFNAAPRKKRAALNYKITTQRRRRLLQKKMSLRRLMTSLIRHLACCCRLLSRPKWKGR